MRRATGRLAEQKLAWRRTPHKVLFVSWQEQLVKPVPSKIGGATVICYTPIDGRHRHTGNCRQIVAGVPQGAAAGLAICQYEGEDSFYLFGCDANWQSITDTWHETLEDAKRQAEFEYEGASGTWVSAASPAARPAD